MEDQPLATSEESTSDDRLWAALGYPIPIISLSSPINEGEERYPLPAISRRAVDRGEHRNLGTNRYRCPSNAWGCRDLRSIALVRNPMACI